MAKYIVQIVMAGVQVVGRAFTRALRQEFQESSEAASRHKSSREGKKQAATDSYTGISVQEAMKILNLSDSKDTTLIEKNYKHLFEVNDKPKGGSLYIQSKIVRAKERLDAENTSKEANTDTGDKTKSQTKDET